MLIRHWELLAEEENAMKKLFNRLLLLFGKKRYRVQTENGFKYKVVYKLLLGHEYIIHKTLAPIAFHSGNVELPFMDFQRMMSARQM